VVNFNRHRVVSLDRHEVVSLNRQAVVNMTGTSTIKQIKLIFKKIQLPSRIKIKEYTEEDFN